VQPPQPVVPELAMALAHQAQAAHTALLVAPGRAVLLVRQAAQVAQDLRVPQVHQLLVVAQDPAELAVQVVLRAAPVAQVEEPEQPVQQVDQPDITSMVSQAMQTLS